MTDVQLPDIPPQASKDKRDDYYKDRYQKQLDIAQALEVTRQDTALALRNTREDKQREVSDAREATALAVKNARKDKARDVDNTRGATALALKKAREDKAREVESARDDTATAVMEARVDADRAAELALVKSIHDAYITVTTGTLDRSVSRAQFLTATIGAVSGTYTTLLGVNFAVASNKPAPGRALIPVLFFAIALACAAFYVAFLKRTAANRRLLPTAIGGAIAEVRLQTFMEWTLSGVMARAGALRTSVVAFAVGIATLPLPFVSISTAAEVILIVVGAAIVLVDAAVELVLWTRQRQSKTQYVNISGLGLTVSEAGGDTG